jgi:hypothetical protein
MGRVQKVNPAPIERRTSAGVCLFLFLVAFNKGNGHFPAWSQVRKNPLGKPPLHLRPEMQMRHPLVVVGHRV